MKNKLGDKKMIKDEQAYDKMKDFYDTVIFALVNQLQSYDKELGLLKSLQERDVMDEVVDEMMANASKVASKFERQTEVIEWVKTEERFPEKSGYYLCSYLGGDYIDFDYFGSGGFKSKVPEHWAEVKGPS